MARHTHRHSDSEATTGRDHERQWCKNLSMFLGRKGKATGLSKVAVPK